METKAATCGVRAGRRPRGKELTEFVESLRAQTAKTRQEPAETRETAQS